MATEREIRALRRASWPGGLTPTHTVAQLPSAAERLGSMWQLALDAWATSGRPLPDYDRASMPGKVIRPV